MKRTALIDFDVLVYRCGFAAQHKEYYVYDKTAMDMGWVAMFQYKKDALSFIKEDTDLYITENLIVEPEENAFHNIKASVHSIMVNTRSDDYIGYLSGDNNFRYKIATHLPYKGNRDPDAKPVHYDALRKYILMQYNAEIVDGMEADDALGINQYENLEKEKEETIICTIDKDLNMIPGWHYNFVTQECFHIDHLEAIRNFYKQLLTGDLATDNIQGIYGIGPVKADKLLKDCADEYEMYEVVSKIYEEKWPTTNWQAALIENGRLLWILRKPSEMWHPPVDKRNLT